MSTDYFRDTWVRYLGYANEVGEAFRPVVPRFVVRASYKVAFGYVIADTVDKSWKELRDNGMSKVAVEAGDALIWQTLASVIIPGFTINRISKYTHLFLTKRAQKLAPQLRACLTVVVGLVCIPIIVHPIDTAVTAFMDLTYRKYFI